VIRRAAAADTAAVARLFRRSFGTLTFLPTLHTPEEDLAFFERVVREQEVWVADEEGVVVGFSALDGEMLSHLYVDPDAHRRGVGSALLEHAKAVRPGGFAFWVFERNDGARRFYERHRCRAIRFTDGAGNEEREPDALYEWRP
jgi:GNAT superfamily N-acetyltransferase